MFQLAPSYQLLQYVPRSPLAPISVKEGLQGKRMFLLPLLKQYVSIYLDFQKVANISKQSINRSATWLTAPPQRPCCPPSRPPYIRLWTPAAEAGYQHSPIRNRFNKQNPLFLVGLVAKSVMSANETLGHWDACLSQILIRVRRLASTLWLRMMACCHNWCR